MKLHPQLSHSGLSVLWVFYYWYLVKRYNDGVYLNTREYNFQNEDRVFAKTVEIFLQRTDSYLFNLAEIFSAISCGLTLADFINVANFDISEWIDFVIMLRVTYEPDWQPVNEVAESEKWRIVAAHFWLCCKTWKWCSSKFSPWLNPQLSELCMKLNHFKCERPTCWNIKRQYTSTAILSRLWVDYYILRCFTEYRLAWNRDCEPGWRFSISFSDSQKWCG